MSDNRPIGIFDSGLGGLTVLKAVQELLPNESLVYFGDSGRTPYGTKSPETVQKYTFQDINFLLEHQVKMIVIACNTASACSLDAVLKQYTLPIVEVVGPGSRAAVRTSKKGQIGVIGTPATIASGVYERAIQAATARLTPDRASTYYGKACPLFVPLVEEGWWDREVTALTVQEYMKPLQDAGVDTVVLGCTHYPLLQSAIQKEMGPEVTLVNSALEVAREVQAVLTERDIATGEGGQGSVSFFTSDSVEKFAELGSIFLGKRLENVTKIDIEAR
ncbi:MAG: glutamate racemase [Clostridia bacterium]|nr:glutamate racemase [Clostridia bacterium]